jgi:hypothetical protein
MMVRPVGRRVWALALAACALAPAAAAAQQLPPAEQLVQRYVQAVGGRDALLAPRTTRTRGTFEMPATGLAGELEVVSGKPNRVATRVTIAGIGEIRNGYDGQTGWSVDPMMGARLLTGGELEAAREQADPMAAVRDPSVFTSMTTVEQTTMGGQACYKVRLVWKSGRESYDCYAVDGGLLVASVNTQESPMGNIEVTTVVSDYRQFGNVRMPTRMSQEMMGNQQVITVTSVEFDVVDDAAFTPPAEISALRGN